MHILRPEIFAFEWNITVVLNLKATPPNAATTCDCGQDTADFSHTASDFIKI